MFIMIEMVGRELVITRFETTVVDEVA